jgi:hypothetical protein
LSGEVLEKIHLLIGKWSNFVFKALG